MRGYLNRRAPGHPLAPPSCSVGAHRLVLWDKIGPGTHPCRWCARPVAWFPQPGQQPLHVDHVDHDGLNNDPTNLVASCRNCNVARGVSWRACRREGIEWTGSAEQSYLGARMSWAENAAQPPPVYARARDGYVRAAS